MIGISIYKRNTYIYLEVQNMTLYYCETKDGQTKTIYNVVKKGNNWQIYNVSLNDKENLTSTYLGTMRTKKDAIEAMRTTFDNVTELVSRHGRA